MEDLNERLGIEALAYKYLEERNELRENIIDLNRQLVEAKKKYTRLEEKVIMVCKDAVDLRNRLNEATGFRPDD